jgi:LysM repeat protein
LGAIATEYSTSVDDIMAHNGLRNHIIGIGQSLVIPVKGQVAGATILAQNGGLSIAAEMNDVTHVVGRGDTLWEIAQEYKTTVGHLLELNELSWAAARKLQLGQKLVVRRSSRLLAMEGAMTSPSSYVVKRGDSLWSIAQKHGVAVDDLIRWNSLGDKTIHPGKKLVLGGVR